MAIFQVSGPTSGRPLVPGSADVVREQLAGRKAIGQVSRVARGSLDVLATLKAGARISLPLSDRESVEGTVNSVSVQPDGAVSVIGGLAAKGDSFSFARSAGGIDGLIQLESRKMAFRLGQDAAGDVLLSEVLLSDVICLPPDPGTRPARKAIPATKPKTADDGLQPATAKQAISNSGQTPLTEHLKANGVPTQVGQGVVTQSVSEPAPILNSRPTAVAQLYLSFDGETVTGTQWNGGNPIVAAPAGLTAAQIVTVFNEVAEAFRPFDINVTTDAAKYGAAQKKFRMKCVVTPTNTASGGNPDTLGIAYINVFGRNDDVHAVCWAFTFNVPNYGIAGVGTVISHEVGHTFGLTHDGLTYYGNGSYFGGHGQGAVNVMVPGYSPQYTSHWCPIMGSSLSIVFFEDYPTAGVTTYIAADADIVQWSKGEYQDANNFQDDVEVINQAIRVATGSASGYAPDEAGATAVNAAPLPVSGTSISQSGIIATAADDDFYSFATSGGPVTFTAALATRPNLDIALELRDAAQTVVASSNPSSTVAATVSTTLAAGTYYVKLSGSGDLDPLTTGYTKYGSIGAYTLTGTGNFLASPPTVSTPSSTNIAATTATLGGTVESANGASVIECGVVCAPTAINADPVIGGSGVILFSIAGSTGAFTVNATGLTERTPYSFKAYARNSLGTTYTSVANFSTPGRPIVTTPTITNVNGTQATLGGTVASDGGATISARGIVIAQSSTNSDPVIGGAGVSNFPTTGTTGVFATLVYSLSLGTGYSFKAYATNNQGTSYSTVATFTTVSLPIVTTGAASGITTASATLGGTVNPNNGSTVVTFYYGTDTYYGQTVTAVQSPVSGSTATAVSAVVSGLQPHTLYHFMVEGQNWVGNRFGSDATFTTANSTPAAAAQSGLTTNEDVATSITLSGTDADGDTLNFAVASQPGHGTVSITGNTAIYTPAANYNGADSFTFNASDGFAGGVSAAATVSLTVNAVNDRPTFALSSNAVSIAPSAGAQTTSAFVTAISPGPADEAGQTVSFNVSNNQNTLFTAQPAIAANGTLTFTPSPSATGSATVTVTAQDNGGTANGGIDTSAAQTFTITLTETTPPTLTAVTMVSSNANTAQAKVSDTITLSFSASEALQTPTVVLAGRPAAVSGSGANWTAAITVLNTDTQGTTTLSIVFKDLAGNNGTTVTALTSGGAVNIDRTAPATPASAPALAADLDTGSSNSDGITKTTVLTFTGTAEAGATVTLFDTNGTTVVGTGTATGGAYIITSAALGEGLHSITGKASDAAGNLSGASAGASVRIDTTPPTFTLPANITAEATSAAGALVSYTASASDTGGSGVETSSFLPASGGTFGIAITQVNASATDKAGNTATDSFNITVLDTTAPAITVTGANPATVERLATYTDEGATATDLVDGTRTVTTSGTVNTAVVGVNTISYTASDTRSNSRTVTRTVNVVDTVAPTVAMSSTAGDPPASLPISVMVTFSESVTGFTAADIATGNATVQGLTGSGASYSFSLVPNGQGLVTADIAAAAAQDTGGNGNTVAAQFSRSVTNAVSISATDPNAAEGGSNPGVYRLTRAVSSGALTVKFHMDNSAATTASTADFSLAGGSVTFDSVTRNGTVTFPNGQTTVDLTLTAIADAVQAAEPAKTVTFAVDADTGYTVGSPANATVTIAANGFVVTHLGDAGEGSLRQAVLNANALTGTDTITFSDGTAGTINFTDGIARTITLTSGEMALTTHANITGPGALLLSISGNNASRVFNLSGNTCTISGLTFTRGNAGGSFGNAIVGGGFNTLTMNDCRLVGNTTTSGTAVMSMTQSNLTVNRTTVSGNTCNSVSGIYMQSTTAVIRDCTFSGNSGSSGAALHLTSGGSNATLTLINSTVSGNNVTNGASITFAGNAGRTTSATLTNCTVTNNTVSAAGQPGAIRLAAGPTFAVTLNNTIVSGNTTAGVASNITGTVLTASANNLIGTGNGGLTNGTNGNKIGLDNPVVGPLASNGGGTQTHALLFGSPAIDAGDATLAKDQHGNTLAFDQRGAGFDRAFGAVDIGAYELQKSIAITADLASAVEGSGGGNAAFAFTLTRTGDTSTAVTADYAVTGSGANPANAADFANGTLPSGQATFPAGATTVPITIDVNKDASAELDESFTVTLTNPTGGYILSGSAASSTITNDDALTVTLDQAFAQVDPAAAGPINFTAVFSEAVSGFDQSDVTLSGTASATIRTVTEIAPNDGTTYLVAVSGMTSPGTVLAAISAGRAQSLGGLGNLASTSTDNTVLFDNVPPATPGAPTLAAASDSGSSNNDGITSNTSLTLTGTVEAGATVTLFDGAVAGTSATATGGNYSITQTFAAGTHGLTVKATDAAGNTSAPSAAASVTVDTTAPVVTPPANGVIHATSPSGVVVTYTAATATDNVTASPAITYSDVSGTTFAPGIKTVTVIATDAAGNAGTASFTITVTPLTAAELWRYNNFGSADNNGAAAALADPDGDGLPNVVELGFFTDPNDPSTGNSALEYIGTFAGGGTIVATGQPRAMAEGTDVRALFMRRSDFAAAGLSYIVEFTADFTTWAASGATPTVLADNGVAQIVSVPYPLLVAGKPARFFRVEVSIAP